MACQVHLRIQFGLQQFNFKWIALARSNSPCTLEHILLTAFLRCVRSTGSEAERRNALLVYGALTIFTGVWASTIG